MNALQSQWWRVACARFNTIPTAAVPLNASSEHHRRPESVNIYSIFGLLAAFRTSPVAPPTKWQTAHSRSAILRSHLSVSRAGELRCERSAAHNYTCTLKRPMNGFGKRIIFTFSLWLYCIHGRPLRTFAYTQCPAQVSGGIPRMFAST